MMMMRKFLLEEVAPRTEVSSDKISIIGTGMVGMACAFSILAQNISSNIALVDATASKLKGEMLDLQHGALFIKNPKIQASTDFAVTAGSRICIITAGARQRQGETRLDLVQRNVDIMKTLLPKIIAHCPNTILLIVTNPVDIITYVAWKISGFPKYRVIGTGTNLDSSRLRFFMSQRLDVAPSSCHGWVIGEHGDSSVVVWSSLNVAGVRLQRINPRIGTNQDPENWTQVHKEVINSGYDIVKLKGYTSWAIALSITDLVSIILNNSRNVRAVSVHVMGYHGIKEDVFLSLPVVLGTSGVSDIVEQHLSNDEVAALQNSAKVMSEVQSKIHIK